MSYKTFFKYVVVISAALFILTGCVPRASISSTFQFVGSNANEGLVAFSVQCVGWNRPIRLSYTGRPIEVIDWVAPDIDSIVFECSDNYPKYYMLKLMPGTYQFTGLASGNYSSDSQLHYKYKVYKGKVTYIGNLRFNFVSKYVFRTSIYDERNRDLALFYAKYSNIPKRDYIVDLLSEGKR